MRKYSATTVLRRSSSTCIGRWLTRSPPAFRTRPTSSLRPPTPVSRTQQRAAVWRLCVRRLVGRPLTRDVSDPAAEFPEDSDPTADEELGESDREISLDEIVHSLARLLPDRQELQWFDAQL